MSQLRDAVDILMDRKKVVAESSEDERGLISTVLTDDATPKMFIGTDLDVKDTIEVAERHAQLATTAILMGEAMPFDSFMGIWIDGLLTGLVLAELRQKNGTVVDDDE